jgi:hypothetical protein
VDFEARRLRVQLPCGDDTLIACVFGTCRLPSRITCLWRTPYCPAWISICGWRTDICPTFNTRICPDFSEILCRAGSQPIPGCGISEEWIQVELDDLPILREQLEGQLKVVNEAIAKADKQNK